MLSLLQLKDNIEKLFTWFVEEGKATVRIKEPAVDICLSKVQDLVHMCKEMILGVMIVCTYIASSGCKHNYSVMGTMSPECNVNVHIIIRIKCFKANGVHGTYADTVFQIEVPRLKSEQL